MQMHARANTLHPTDGQLRQSSPFIDSAAATLRQSLSRFFFFNVIHLNQSAWVSALAYGSSPDTEWLGGGEELTC